MTENEEEGIRSYLTKRGENGNLKKKVLYRTMCRTRFGKGYGPVIRQTTEMNEFLSDFTTESEFQ